MPANHYPIADVLPHDAPMVLLDHIERRWDSGIETAVTIRALSAEGVEIFVDGERFSGDPTALDPATIERVEVQKGQDGFPDRVAITLKK